MEKNYVNCSDQKGKVQTRWFPIFQWYLIILNPLWPFFLRPPASFRAARVLIPSKMWPFLRPPAFGAARVQIPSKMWPFKATRGQASSFKVLAIGHFPTFPRPISAPLCRVTSDSAFGLPTFNVVNYLKLTVFGNVTTWGIETSTICIEEFVYIT